MAVRRSTLAAVVATCALLGALMVAPGFASAAKIHPPIETFGLNGESTFPKASSLAVDESTGVVYVYDYETESIYKFTADGAPSEFSALKTNVIPKISGEVEAQLAVDNSSGPNKGDLYFANRFKVYIFASTGQSLGELTGAGNPYTGEQCGVAVGPTGDVYVSEKGKYVNRYTPTGNPVKNSDYVDSLYYNSYPGICEIAVDSLGNLYGADANFVRYSLLEFNTLGQEAVGIPITGQVFSPAVDRLTNDVYVDTTSEILQYDPTGAQVASISGIGFSVAVAVNAASGRVYTADFFGGPVRVFGPLVVVADVRAEASEVQSTTAMLNGVVNPSGVAVTACDFEYGKTASYGHSVPCSPAPGSGNSDVPVSADLTGLEESTTYHFRLKAVNAEAPNSTEDMVFTTTGPPTGGLGFTETARTEATFNAGIDPHGFDTTYRFEYGTDASYGSIAPVPDGDIGAALGNTNISVPISGLKSGATYHFRLVAHNSHGEFRTGDSAFTTVPPAHIERESSRDVRTSTATLQAEVNPIGTDTSYRFEYGTTTSYGTDIPLPDGVIGAAHGNQLVLVSAKLNGLQANTVYHFRVVASNLYGTVTGPDRTLTTFEETSVGGLDTCANAAYRKGLSAALPDCRAYEMVSPVDKNGADVIAMENEEFLISPSGERLQFFTRTGMGETKGSGNGGYSQYLAVRGPGGWSSHGIIPTEAYNEPFQALTKGTVVVTFNEEMDRALLETYTLPGVSGGVPYSDNLYIEDTLSTSVIEPVTIPEAPEPEGNKFMFAQGTSVDLGVVVFESPINLVPQATGKEPKFYAFNRGKMELVGYLPDGSLSPAGAASPYFQSLGLHYEDAVSRDGSRIVFISPTAGFLSQLYLRKDGTSTAWVSEPETSGPSFVPHGVHFQTSTPDGKHVFFTSEQSLLDVDGGSEGSGLYMYTDGPSPQSESNLTFIARGPSVAVKGVSDDGSHVYFNSGDRLFLSDKGQIHQIAPDNPGEEAMVSPDGRQLVFPDDRTITSREISINGFGKTEIYLYDEASDTVNCVSCPPSGATPTSGVEIEVAATGQSNPSASFPAPLPRFFSSAGGFIFFNTAESLVPQDTNGVVDAYEYNTHTGKLLLLSPGTGEKTSWFVEASPSGNDVLLATRERLTGWDEDNLDDVYDVRVNGGFSEPPPPRVVCEGDACQGVPSAVPSFNTASGFTGLGNLLAAPTSHSSKKSVTNAEKLKRALKLCAKKSKGKRASCRAQARKRYAKKSSVKSVSRRAGR